MLFSKDKSRSMQDLLLEHARLVMQCIENFQNMIGALRVLDLQRAREFENLVDKFETEADNVHRDNVTQICKGSFFGYMREDILQMMELVDSIADSAKEAARALMWRKVPEQILVKFLDDTAMNYVKESSHTARSLLAVLESLNMKRDVVIEKVRVVEQLEEGADILKNRLFQELYSKADEYDTLTVLQLKEFIDLTDNIADKAEDASDVVLVMLAKGYS
ncbi:MAG: TIGR00153 family protein [Nitrososphaerales archaeon]